MVKAAYAQLMFRLGGADEQQMARIRDSVADLCKGWRVDQVNQIVNETLHELINPYVYAEAAALINEHRAAGRDVVVVSTSGEEMVRPIADAARHHRRHRHPDGGRPRPVHRRGRLLRRRPDEGRGGPELAKERDYDLSTCYAYSDSVSDVPLLEAVGHPTAVNPDRGLRRVAAERGWQVLEFRHPVPLSRRLRARPAVPVAAAAIGLGVGRGHRARDLRPLPPCEGRDASRIARCPSSAKCRGAERHRDSRRDTDHRIRGYGR